MQSEFKQDRPENRLPTEPASRLRAYKDYLEDPVFEEAIHNYRDQIIGAWLATKPADVAEREMLWYSFQNVMSVKGNILRSFTKATNDLHVAQIINAQNKDTRNI